MSVSLQDKELWAIRGFLALSSSDLFFENRALFDGDFFTLEHQSALRRWLTRCNFEIPVLPADFERSFSELRRSVDGSGRTSESLCAYLSRGADPKDTERQRSYHRWVTLLIVLNSGHLVVPPLPLLVKGLSVAEGLFLQPRRVSLDFLSYYRREWDSYAEGQQKQYNLRVKTAWDRTLYENFCLRCEYSLSDGLSAISSRNFFFDFVAEWQAQFARDDRRRFCQEALQVAMSDEDLELPALMLDDLVDPH